MAHSKAEYDRQVSFLDSILDEVGEDENHPLASLVETIGSLVETYETAHLPEHEGAPVDILKCLMQEHGVRQGDLPEIVSQGLVSEILSGKRRLNTRQVKALGKRFGVSPVVFI
ncbi:helix-turn-helix domain-containing protein [Desulfobacter postgatei]|uniref:Putative transcription regulator containing HTH domain n=1 Tax=Desulfobacter postgatei 2ac9 TaxID=879212 RepID=I5B589_9BACT|nr:transcriptional regulator [Desulfobacter postgatei]EIM64652.1 putative transcription regulator containing HTH domain [Desulfobacter postgatei 2ac9]